MNTAQVGDIAEQTVALFALKQGWGVLKPIGNRLPYDLVLDIFGKLVRIQVKSAWKKSNGSYVAETRRCKTNRKKYLIERYSELDFDFFVAVVEDDFFIIPINVFLEYKAAISFFK